MNVFQPCSHHRPEVRQRLYADPALGFGNFLAKVLDEDVDCDGWLFELEQAWTSPSGHTFWHLSLAEIREIVEELADWYRSFGVRSRDVVLTYTSEGISQFLHGVALMAIGAIPAPVNWRMPPPITLLYHQRYGFDYLVVDKHGHVDQILELVRSEPYRSISLLDASRDQHRNGGGSRSVEDWRQYGSDDELVMLCHSSGTTGVPKAVMFGHQQFFHGKRDRLTAFLEREQERMLSALPHSHSAGFSYLMTAVLLGLPTRVLSDLTGPDLPRHLIEFQPTVIVGFSQTYAALAGCMDTGNIPCLHRAYNTGDTAHASHVESLLRAAPNLRFHDGFGASELGMALFCAVSSNAQHGRERRNVGRPVAFAEARIVDECGNSLPPGSIGYLAMRSPTLTAGYYRDPLLTNRCRTESGDWLTGDIGFLNEAGEFIHLDRAVDVMETPQGPAYTLALEEAVLRDGGVHDVNITGVPLTPRTSQAVVAYIQIAPESASAVCNRLLGVLDEELTQSLGGPAPVAVVNLTPQVHAPTGATGKALKRVLRDEFWPALQAWNEKRDGPFTHAVHRHF